MQGRTQTDTHRHMFFTQWQLLVKSFVRETLAHTHTAHKHKHTITHQHTHSLSTHTQTIFFFNLRVFIKE